MAERYRPPGMLTPLVVFDQVSEWWVGGRESVPTMTQQPYR